MRLLLLLLLPLPLPPPPLLVVLQGAKKCGRNSGLFLQSQHRAAGRCKDAHIAALPVDDCGVKP